MADRAASPPADPPLTGRAADIVRWLVEHQGEVNAIPIGQLRIDWGRQEATFALTSSERVAFGREVRTA